LLASGSRVQEFQTLVWLVNSPDLNPVENFCHTVKINNSEDKQEKLSQTYVASEYKYLYDEISQY